MTLETIQIPKEEAAEKWKEAIENQKLNKKAELNSYLRDMRRAYYYLKKGHKILDLFETLKTTGLNADGDPKLAIVSIESKTCLFRKEDPGRGIYYRDTNGRIASWKVENQADSIKLPDNTFGPWPRTPNRQWNEINRPRLSSPTPVIPPNKMQNGEQLYIMWEVEHWTPIAPKDPLLLRRITKNLFVIYAHWNTTKLERAIIRGRL